MELNVEKQNGKQVGENSVRRPRHLVWSGYAVFIWSIGYMLPHLYWAMGGKAGMSLLKPSVSELAQWELINWIASFILTLPGLLGIALIYFHQRKPLNWLLLTIAWAGSAVAASHGIYGIFYRLFQLTGVAELENDPFTVSEHAYVLNDLLIFEPWFFIEGILLILLGYFCFDKTHDRRRWLMICALGVVAGLLSGLVGVRFF